MEVEAVVVSHQQTVELLLTMSANDGWCSVAASPGVKVTTAQRCSFPASASGQAGLLTPCALACQGLLFNVQLDYQKTWQHPLAIRSHSLVLIAGGAGE